MNSSTREGHASPAIQLPLLANDGGISVLAAPRRLAPGTLTAVA